MSFYSRLGRGEAVTMMPTAGVKPAISPVMDLQALLSGPIRQIDRPLAIQKTIAITAADIVKPVAVTPTPAVVPTPAGPSAEDIAVEAEYQRQLNAMLTGTSWFDGEMISGVKNKWLAIGGAGVLAVGALLMMRKKKSAVAGYRRRSRR